MITKTKDNMTNKDEKYMDSEMLRDNFNGTEAELKVIAETVFECVDATNEDDWNFMDECQSMLDCDYDYLNPQQYHEVLEFIDRIIIKGEL